MKCKFWGGEKTISIVQRSVFERELCVLVKVHELKMDMVSLT